MIKYSLACRKGHRFDAWFKSSGDYDRQARRGLVTCPDCGSAKVDKAIMAPRVAKRRSAAPERAPKPVPASPPTSSDTPMQATGGAVSKDQARLAEMQREVFSLMRKVRAEVEKTSDYVGPKFAEEARKIHYRETEPRGIYGEATTAEVKDLLDEGVECYPLPRLPEDQN